MELLLKRRFLAETYTIGSVFVNGTYFCDTLEDKTRDRNRNGIFDGGEKKIMHHTAIPYGIYPVVVRWSASWGRPLPRLLNVPEFEGILIHRGNTEADTSGCILVGENKVKGRVIHSADYEIKLTQMISEAQNRQEPITIQIV